MTSAVRRDAAGGAFALLAPLRDRNFALLACGQSLSNVGDALYEVALPLLVLAVSGTTDLGLVLGCYGVARIAGLLAAGPVVARYGPRPVMAVIDVVRAALLATLGGFALSGGLTVVILAVFSVPYGVCMGLFRPAYSTLPPRLVGPRHLPAANAVLTTSVQCAMFVGAVMGGVLVGAGRAGVALLVDAVTFIASAATLIAMRVRAEPAERAGDGVRQVRRALSGTALAVLWANPLIVRLLVVVGVVNLLWGGLLEVALPSLLTENFGAGGFGYGLLLSAAGVGALIGALLVGSQKATRQTGGVAFSAGVAQGVLLAILPWSQSIFVAAGAMFVVGVLNSVTNVIMLSYLQVLSPAARLPYVMSVMWLLSFGLYPLSVVVSGLLVAGTSPALAFAASAAVLVLGFLIGLAEPRLRKPLAVPDA